MIEKQREKRVPCAADHRLDEPTGLPLGMVASPQCPLGFRPARLIVAPRCPAVSTSGLTVTRAEYQNIDRSRHRFSPRSTSAGNVSQVRLRSIEV